MNDDHDESYAVPGRPHLKPTMAKDIFIGEGPFTARAAQVPRIMANTDHCALP
jgi:hypothetical protein